MEFLDYYLVTQGNAYEIVFSGRKQQDIYNNI